ncbi:MAG: hypothetical protein AB7K71_39935 [Polyangiaceae bacterium]
MSPAEPAEYGPTYTKGRSFRARAEARQRMFRATKLGAACDKWGHLLSPDATESGANFIVTEAHDAARDRAAAGKGVALRTFNNMLSSQAMCFNIFAPLAVDLDLASSALGSFVPQLQRVTAIHIEYTPAKDVFGDQSGRGGVDCDVLVEGVSTDGDGTVAILETKFVEPEFSSCSFRNPSRAKEGKSHCPDSLVVTRDGSNCLYASAKGYGYWQRTLEHKTLRPGLLPGACPFGGPGWQLWVNHTLAAHEAKLRGARHGVFGVVAPKNNDALLRDGSVLSSFAEQLTNPDSVLHIDVGDLVARLAQERTSRWPSSWVSDLVTRYVIE